MEKNTMGSRSPRPLAVLLAFAVLLAAAGNCRGEDNVTVQDNVAVQDNAAVQENRDVDQEDLREPDFGGKTSHPVVADPIEPVNRGIFYVNDKLYRWVFKPVAKGYKYVVPEDVRVAVRNFFLNLATPIRAANTLLQGKFKATGTELARFTINTTLGMAGLFDAAKDWDLKRRDGDTGQTLGVYGLGHGFYLILPILGPSSARDAVGVVGDTFLDPLTYLLEPRDVIYSRAFRSENDLSFHLNEYEELTGGAVDPYIAVRDAYIQYREKRVKE